MTVNAIKGNSLYAAIIAVAVVLVLGLGHHILESQLGLAESRRTPVDPNALVGLPVRIGDWEGTDVELDEYVIQATDSDAHVNRAYVHSASKQRASFYACCGNNAEILSHQPLTCYGTHGWQLLGSKDATLHSPGGKDIPYLIFQVERGDLRRDRLAVLCYFVLDGEYFSDMSDVKSRQWGYLKTFDYAGQVQIVVQSGSSDDMSAEETALAFARESAPAIRALFAAIERERGGD